MKFRKKPVVIEATQWFKDGDHPNVKKWNDNEYRVTTLEGAMIVTPGDWIITGVKGEYYPCKPDIFEMTYEPLYTTPQARPWVDLSDSQIEQVYYDVAKLHRGAPMPWGQVQFGNALQALVKEKNA